MPSRKPGIRVCCVMTNRAMTLFTSLGPSADCRGLTQVTTYQVRTGHARGAAFSVSQRGFSLGWGLQGKVARTPHQSKGSGGTVCWGGLLVGGSLLGGGCTAGSPPVALGQARTAYAQAEQTPEVVANAPVPLRE